MVQSRSPSLSRHNRSVAAAGSGPQLPGGQPAAPPLAPADCGLSPAEPVRRGAAIAWLLFATVLWGASFPLGKSVMLAQSRLDPDADSWDLTALNLALRFGVAGALVAVASWRTLRSALTAAEVSQGVGLGVFAGIGMLFQLDGLNYTAASTSSFLTSCYCVIIPVIVALRRRRFPTLPVAVSCLLATVGIAVLAGVDWRTVRLGRGEAETLIASFAFAGQIFWLERPMYAGNRTAHSTAVMFAVLAIGALGVVLLRDSNPRLLFHAAFGSPALAGCLAVLTVFCTLITFSLMNHWQRHVEASEAGLIYCAEPLWTSLTALFLPGFLAGLFGVIYANEQPTLRLLVGGTLITVANVFIQIRRN